MACVMHHYWSLTNIVSIVTFNITMNFYDSQREAFSRMEKKQMHVWPCSVCNVNLCSVCEIEFHGVQMCETAKLLGK
jgi:hypothetical protein